VLLLGFTPYRPEIYQHHIHGKSVEKFAHWGSKATRRSFRVRASSPSHSLLVGLVREALGVQPSGTSSPNISQLLDPAKRFENFLNEGLILSFKEIVRSKCAGGEDVEECTTLDPRPRLHRRQSAKSASMPS